MANIINNTQNATATNITETNFPTNGNCKRVRDITNNIPYGSITEAAIKNSVTIQAMSKAIRDERLCNGSLFMLEVDLEKNKDKLCEQAAKANARAAKAEARLSGMEDIIAKAKAYDKLMAEQERARKEEEARLEKERKAEEKRQAKITKLETKIERYGELISRVEKKREKLWAKQMDAIIELEALKNNGKEVK